MLLDRTSSVSLHREPHLLSAVLLTLLLRTASHIAMAANIVARRLSGQVRQH
jgi:hypothetical protein